jgi:cholesterol transport system auxiliary component
MKKRAVLVGVLLLGACVKVGEGGKPPRQMFTLPPVSAPAGGLVTATPITTLAVSEPEAERALGLTRIAVRVNDTSIAYMKEGLWSERPARLLRNHIAEVIRARGRRLVLVDSEDGAQAGQHLGGRLIFMGYDDQTRSAVIRYDALLTKLDGTLAQRRFEAVEKGVAPKPEAVAQALGRMSDKLAAEVADWVG